MTLLIAMVRDDFSVLLADRRVSLNGKVLEDEFNKICVFFCKDAKIAIAFTGVATLGEFNTADWIATTLAESSTEDSSLSEVIEALRDQLGQKMQSLGLADCRLTLLCAGYVYWTEHPEPRIYEISNVGAGGVVNRTATLRAICQSSGEPVVELAGFVNAVPKKTVERLQALLEKRELSPQNILRFSVKHLQNAAQSSASLRTIGEQCNSAVLFQEVDSAVTSTYHAAKNTNRAYAANLVIAGSGSFTNPQMTSPLTLAGPPVRAQDQCWCGSGISFGKCHLQKFGAVYARTPMFRHPLPMTSQVTRENPWASGRVFCVTSSYA